MFNLSSMREKIVRTEKMRVLSGFFCYQKVKKPRAVPQPEWSYKSAYEAYECYEVLFSFFPWVVFSSSLTKDKDILEDIYTRSRVPHSHNER